MGMALGWALGCMEDNMGWVWYGIVGFEEFDGHCRSRVECMLRSWKGWDCGTEAFSRGAIMKTACLTREEGK